MELMQLNTKRIFTLHSKSPTMLGTTTSQVVVENGLSVQTLLSFKTLLSLESQALSLRLDQSSINHLLVDQQWPKTEPFLLVVVLMLMFSMNLLRPLLLWPQMRKAHSLLAVLDSEESQLTRLPDSQLLDTINNLDTLTLLNKSLLLQTLLV